MDAVRNFGRAARKDRALMGELIRIMTGFLGDEEDGLVQWEMETEEGTLIVEISAKGNEVDLFTPGGEKITLGDGLKGELEREAEKIMDEARADAEDGIESAQAVKDTEEALWTWR